MTSKKSACSTALALLVGVSLNIAVQNSVALGRTPTHTVDMLNHSGTIPFVYRPATLVVRAGTRVIWRNRSSQPHTVTPTGKQLAFDVTASAVSGAKDIEPKHQWSFVFRHPGTYAYYCEFHPYMKGKVVVKK